MSTSVLAAPSLARQRPFVLFWLARLASTMGYQMLAVTIGWQAPDDKRWRVSAINYLFVGSSNTLGEFESGAVAAWLGAVPSVLIGGFGALLVAGIWMLLFPDLRRIDRFEPADKQKAEA